MIGSIKYRPKIILLSDNCVHRKVASINMSQLEARFGLLGDIWWLFIVKKLIS